MSELKEINDLLLARLEDRIPAKSAFNIWFGNFEKRQHEILIYDIEKQNLQKRIPLEKEGPNGLPGIYGCIPFFDSKTFLVSQYDIGRTAIIDDEGNVVRKYDMRQSTDKRNRRGLWVDSRFGLSYFLSYPFTTGDFEMATLKHI